MNPEKPKIDTSKIPALEVRLLAQTFFEAAKRFYADPENVRLYEIWEKERQAKEDS